MTTPPSLTLTPRKQPRQARSQVTVDAIFEATIQVLLAEGLQRLTTIRVAERAGVSIGTLYQYYPNKQALLFGVLQRHLMRVGDTVEQAAIAAHHTPLASMVRAVIEAFVNAKTERIDEARALLVVAAELDSRELVQTGAGRVRDLLTTLLATATDAQFDDLTTVTFVFCSAMVGPTRAVLEGNAPQQTLRALRGHLVSLCLGYLEREARPR